MTLRIPLNRRPFAFLRIGDRSPSQHSLLSRRFECKFHFPHSIFHWVKDWLSILSIVLYLYCILCVLYLFAYEHSFVIVLLCRVTILANNRCGGRHLVFTVLCYQFYYRHLSHVKNLMSFLFSKCNDFYFYKCYMFFCPVKRRLEYIWIWGLLALRNHVCRIPEDFKIVSTYN